MNKKTQSSLLVSLADKLHNATCIVDDYYRVEKKLWERFNANPKQIYWYYNSLRKCFAINLEGHKVLKKNYSEMVKQMKKFVYS